MRPGLVWRLAPVVALAFAVPAYFAGSPTQMLGGAAVLWPFLEFAILLLGVFASVHHADVVAHRTGEPYGTLVLTVAVTVIEVALILSIMLGGDGSATLTRDTVFAVVMLVCNGMVGLCIIVGGFRHGELDFSASGASAYLIVLMPLATLTLILPAFTTSASGPYYTDLQLGFVGVATLMLYGVFLYVQTVRHRDYFLSDSGSTHDDDPDHLRPSMKRTLISAALLLAALVAVVLLAKSFSVSVKSLVTAAGAPAGVIGLLLALLVLLPESIAALRAARRDNLQKSLNLALGSSLATIGLTIPAVSALSVWLAVPMALGLDARDAILLALTFGVSIATFASGRTNILPGFVHLVLFATYAFLIFAP